MKNSTPIRVGHGTTLPAFQRKGGVQSGQYRTNKQKRRDWRKEIH